MDVKFPNVEVKLIGENGNAFSIIGRVSRALRNAKVSKEGIKAFQDEATSGDYDRVLQTVMKTVQIT